MSSLIPTRRDPRGGVSLSLVPEKYRAYRAKLRQLLEASTAGSTRRAYKSQLRRFTNWCGENGLCPLPAAPDTVAAFIAYLAGEGKGAATVNQALSAVSVAHQAAGLDSPTKEIAVRKAVKGFRRLRGTAPRKKPAATAELVKKMLAALEAGGTARDVRDAAILSVGFAGGFRRSELAALNFEDLSWETGDGRECCVIQVRHSKTDQEGRGMEKAVFGSGDPRFSPPLLLRRWLELADIDSGPVFRRIRRGGHVQGTRVTDQVVMMAVRRAAAMAGITLALSAHSLRSGFVTTAVRQGKTPDEIMVQTGHRSMDVLMGYYQRRNVRERNAAKDVLE